MSSTSILREANISTSKRKRNYPTENHKLSCVKRMENGESTSRLAKEIGVAPSTLREWKKEYTILGKLPSTSPKKPKSLKKSQKNGEKHLETEPSPSSNPEDLNSANEKGFVQVSEETPEINENLLDALSPNEPIDSSTQPALPHPDLDEAVFRWFSRNRQQGMFISCARLKTEATSLNKQLTNSSNFSASEQWLSCWKARYGVQYLPETLEKVTTDKMGEREFRLEVQRVLNRDDLKKCQIFNCSDISWSWKSLPNKSTSSDSNRHSTDDYVTVMAFCNADYSLKLPLIIIRRPGNVQVLENRNHLPLYSVESNEPWMFSSILGNWFKRDFVPSVTRFLNDKQLPLKAVLIVDNVRFLPTTLWFGEFKTVFVPRNSTCLIRPFFQHLENVKNHCKNTLIFSLALHIDCDKSKEVRRHLHESITLVNLLNWIYTAWEREKGDKPKEVLESLRSIDAFKDYSSEDLNEWLDDYDDEPVTKELSSSEAIEIVQTPDMNAYVDGTGDNDNGIINPSDAVRYLDSVIEFFCHCRNISETELAALRLARETANSMSI